MVDSSFRTALDFFAKIGVFDVVLPFLLVFSLVFAMLEKTRIFGVEKGTDGEMYTRKNMNAMVAFVIAFFVVASAQVVHTLTVVSANMVILLFASFCFLLLVGSFHKEEKEGFFLKEGFIRTSFIVIMFTGLVVIFLNAIQVDANTTWWDVIVGWLQNFQSNDAVPSVILVLIMIGIILFITAEPGKKAEEKHDH